MEENRRPLLVIGGPTASGKTALSIALARRHGGEIVSADSMQMYRGMDIATAKPSLRERQGVPHHLLNILDPGESFSVAEYVRLAHPIIRDIQDRGRLPIMVGGTGQYASAVVENLIFSPAQEDPVFREALRRTAREEGNESLHRKLLAVDPEAAEKIHPNNVGRVIRALEVFHLTGQTMTAMVERSRDVPSPYESCVLALNFKSRENLYNRIDRRVEDMLESGLLEEAKGLQAGGLSPTAAQAIGYKELVPFLSGEEALAAAVEKIKLETRRYAKRQITWFRRVPGVNWLYVDEHSSQDSLAEAAEAIARERGLLL